MWKLRAETANKGGGCREHGEDTQPYLSDGGRGGQPRPIVALGEEAIESQE